MWAGAGELGSGSGPLAGMQEACSSRWLGGGWKSIKERGACKAVGRQAAMHGANKGHGYVPN